MEIEKKERHNGRKEQERREETIQAPRQVPPPSLRSASQAEVSGCSCLKFILFSCCQNPPTIPPLSPGLPLPGGRVLPLNLCLEAFPLPVLQASMARPLPVKGESFTLKWRAQEWSRAVLKSFFPCTLR